MLRERKVRSRNSRLLLVETHVGTFHVAAGVNARIALGFTRFPACLHQCHQKAAEVRGEGNINSVPAKNCSPPECGGACIVIVGMPVGRSTISVDEPLGFFEDGFLHRNMLNSRRHRYERTMETTVKIPVMSRFLPKGMGIWSQLQSSCQTTSETTKPEAVFSDASINDMRRDWLTGRISSSCRGISVLPFLRP